MKKDHAKGAVPEVGGGRQKKNEKNKELRERLLTFSVEVIKFVGTIPYKKEYDVLNTNYLNQQPQ
jgi:hypothetical protein